MPRRPRLDHAGAWHHVFNRGLARRTVFEGPGDVGQFLDLLDEVRVRGLMEVHAYTLLGTHFHLMVRSPAGALSVAMKEVENRYVRAFNRGRRRDGPLFRGRFGSRPVTDDAYWWTVLRYIDRNAVQAGLVPRSVDHPHGSARWYAGAGGPACLVRSVVEGALSRGGGAYDPADYPVEVAGEGGGWVEEVVGRRSDPGRDGGDPPADLVRSGPDAVQAWMVRKARLGDGTEPGWVLLSAAGIEAAVEEGQRRNPGAASRLLPMLPALLRHYAGLTLEEAGERCGLSAGTARNRARAHAGRLRTDPAYAAAVASILLPVLRREMGSSPGATVIPVRTLLPD